MLDVDRIMSPANTPTLWATVHAEDDQPEEHFLVLGWIPDPVDNWVWHPVLLPLAGTEGVAAPLSWEDRRPLTYSTTPPSAQPTT